MASCHWNYCFKWKTTAHRRREKMSANWFLRVKLCFFLCHFDAFTFILAETLALILVELLVAPLLYCILSYNIKLDADMAVDHCSVQVPWTLLEALDGAGLRKKWFWILTKQILIHSNAKKQTTQHRLASHDVTEAVFSWQYSQIYIRHWHQNQQLTEELLSVHLQPLTGRCDDSRFLSLPPIFGDRLSLFIEVVRQCQGHRSSLFFGCPLFTVSWQTC